MTGEFISTLVSCLLLSPVISSYILDQNPKNYNFEKGEGNKVFLKLYEKCLEMDTEACIGYKLFSTAWNYIQNTTFVQSDDATENGAGRQEMDEHVDGVLLQKFIEFVTPSSLWSSSGAANTARRALKLKKKMLFPILLGVALKFVSLVPLILGKLAFIGIMAIMASKLSLILTGIMGLKKLFSGADGGLSQQQGQYYHDGHYTYYGGGVPLAHQKMTYGVRGRQMGDQEDWAPLVMDESRGLVTDDDKGRFINQKGAKGSKSVGYFAQSVGYGGRDNVRGVSGNTYTTTNENTVHDDSNYRQTKFLESTEVPATRAMKSERNASYETDKNRANLFYQKRQLQHLDMKNKRQDRNLVQGDLNPNTMSHGDTGPVTHHGTLYTRDSAETRVESHVTDDRYDEKSKESVSGGHDEFEAQYKEEKGRQNKATRLAKRHYKGENEGQNHDRKYRAGRRRLDEVEGEHTDATAISRKADHA